MGLQFTEVQGLGRECIKHTYKNLLKFFLKTNKLDTLACECKGVEISLTLDGTKLTNNVFHVACGVKMTDARARDPRSKRLTLDFQSRDYPSTFESHAMKESEDAHEHFQGFF